MKCVCCENSSANLILVTTDFRFKSYLNNINIFKCNKCKLVFQDPRIILKPEDLYSNDFYEPTQSLSLYNKLVFTKIKRKIETLNINIKKNRKLLDIGFGDGKFLDFMNQNSEYEVFGTEISKTGYEISNNRNLKNIYNKNVEDCNFKNNFFDIIVINHVLEHIDDLKKFFKEIYRILKKDGVILIEVPNFNSLERLIFNKYFLHLDSPRHLYHFTNDSLIELSKKYHFKIKFFNGFRKMPFPFGPYKSIVFLLENKLQIKIDNFYLIKLIVIFFLCIPISVLSLLINKKNTINFYLSKY